MKKQMLKHTVKAITLSLAMLLYITFIVFGFLAAFTTPTDDSDPTKVIGIAMLVVGIGVPIMALISYVVHWAFTIED